MENGKHLPLPSPTLVRNMTPDVVSTTSSPMLPSFRLPLRRKQLCSWSCDHTSRTNCRVPALEVLLHTATVLPGLRWKRQAFQTPCSINHLHTPPYKNRNTRKTVSSITVHRLGVLGDFTTITLPDVSFHPIPSQLKDATSPFFVSLWSTLKPSSLLHPGLSSCHAHQNC